MLEVRYNNYIVVMIFFLIIWLIHRLLMHSNIKNVITRKISNVFCVILGLSPFIWLAGSRTVYEGTDTPFYISASYYTKYLSYKYLFSHFPHVMITGRKYQYIETGYVIFNKIIVSIINNPASVLYISAGIMIFNFGKFVKDNGVDLFLGMYIFLCEGIYLNSFNTMRQLLALSILLNAFTQTKREKYVNALVWVGIATLIHQSSIYFVLILIAYRLLYMLSEKNNGYFFFFLLLIPPVLKLLSYTEYSGYLTTNNLYEVSIGRIAILWIVIGVMYLINLHEYLRDKEMVFYGNMFLIYVILQIMSLSITGAQRLSFYFEPFNILLIGRMLAVRLEKSSITKLFIVVILKFLIFILLFFLYISYSKSLTIG